MADVEAVPTQRPSDSLPPDGWTDVEAAYAISMPGFILEEGTLLQQGGFLELVYDPAALSRDFPNIDLKSRHVRNLGGLSDEVFISMLLSGPEASGRRVYAAKHLTLVGEDIYDLN